MNTVELVNARLAYLDKLIIICANEGGDDKSTGKVDAEVDKIKGILDAVNSDE